MSVNFEANSEANLVITRGLLFLRIPSLIPFNNLSLYLSFCWFVHLSEFLFLLMSNYISICLSQDLPFCLSVQWSACLSVQRFACLSIQWSVCSTYQRSACVSVYPILMFVCLTKGIPVCLSNDLSLCLTVDFLVFLPKNLLSNHQSLFLYLPPSWYCSCSRWNFPAQKWFI